MPRFEVVYVKQLMAQKNIMSIPKLAAQQKPPWNADALQKSFQNGTLSDIRIVALAEFFGVPPEKIRTANDAHPIFEQLDYDGWHEHGRDLLTQNEKKHRDKQRVFGTVTFQELETLWTQSPLFVRYEANLCRFLAPQRSGARKWHNEMRRIFIISGAEGKTPWSDWQKTVWRHAKLGFAPRISTWADFCEERCLLVREAGECCNTIAAVMYGEFVLCCEYPENAKLMYRTSDQAIVKAAEQFHERLWNRSNSLEEWVMSRKLPQFERLESEMRRDILADVEYVKRAANLD